MFLLSLLLGVFGLINAGYSLVAKTSILRASAVVGWIAFTVAIIAIHYVYRLGFATGLGIIN